MTVTEQLKSAEASFAMENMEITLESKIRAMDVIEGRKKSEDVIEELMKKYYVPKDKG